MRHIGSIDLATTGCAMACGTPAPLLVKASIRAHGPLNATRQPAGRVSTQRGGAIHGRHVWFVEALRGETQA